MTFTLLLLLVAMALLALGFVLHSRVESLNSLKDWCIQCICCAIYNFAFFIMSGVCLVLILALNHWQIPNTDMMLMVFFYIPSTLTFLTALLVSRRYRDFDFSITAMIVGVVCGFHAAANFMVLFHP